METFYVHFKLTIDFRVSNGFIPIVHALTVPLQYIFRRFIIYRRNAKGWLE